MILFLDRLRSSILSRTLRFSFARSLYRNRSSRIAVLFSAALTFSILLVIVDAKIALYILPLFLGVPHIVASYMYSKPPAKKCGNDLQFLIMSAIVAGIAFTRYLHPLFDTKAYFVPLSILMSVFILKRENSNSARAAQLLAIPASLMIAAYLFPSELAVAILIGHNIVAFVFWFQAARNQSEKKTVFISLLTTITALLTLTHFLTEESPLTQSVQGAAFILLGSQTKTACIVTMCFLVTQGLHYFIWLKAIPDFANTAPTPGGFQHSLKNLKRRLGMSIAPAAIVAISILFLTAYIIGVEQSRILYISLAAYHGLLEISVLITRLSQSSLHLEQVNQEHI